MTRPPEPSTAPVEGVTRPIPLALRDLALPVLASLALRLGYQWVDALWVRGIGVAATAAVTTSVFIMWFVYSLNDVFGIGVTAFVSQLLGAGERERAGVAAWKGLRASMILGLACCAAGVFGAHAIFGVMGGDPATVEQGTAYLSIVLAGAPLIMMVLTCESIMRASGDTRTPFLIDLLAVATNVVLDPLLIYGVGPLPALGVRGAAIATVVAQAITLACYLAVAARGHRAFPLRRHAAGAPVRILGMAKVGVPAALIGTLFSVVYVVFAHVASGFGRDSLAVVGIVNRIEAIEFMFAASLGIAGATLVGQNLGAGRSERAVETIRTANAWGLWVSLGLMAFLLAFPELPLRLFTRDEQVVRTGVPYLRLIALGMPFTSLELVTAESVLGSGHTQVISWIFTGVSLARIPLAFLAPRVIAGGVVAIAWLILFTTVVRTGLIVGWAARGTWRVGLRHELHVESLPAPVAGNPPPS